MILIGFIFLSPTLFGHTNFQFNQKGEKKVANRGGFCSMGSMSEGKERIVAEHPKVCVVRMVEWRRLQRRRCIGGACVCSDF
jgi:hypothetical protein